MLTSLTDAEWAGVAQARESALQQVMVDGVSLDEFRTAAAVCYAAIGEGPPAVVVAPSPVVALIWSAILRSSHGQLDGQLDDQLYGQLGDQLYGQLYGQLGGQLYGQLDGQLDDQLRGQLYDQLYGQLYGQLGGQLYGQLDGQLDDQLRGQLYDQLYGQLDGQLDGQLYGQLGGQLYGQLDGQLRGQLGGQLYGQLYGQLRGQLGDQLYGQLYGQLGGQLGGQLDGCHWSGWRFAWMAHWLHINTLEGVCPAPADLTDATSAYRTFCTPMFTIPLKGVVIGLGPHVQCEMDAGLLHSDRGPAISWIDGYGIHAWRGVRVPQWVIESPTFDLINAEANTEIRRCAIESYGWDRYLADVGTSPVDTTNDPGNPGHILRLFDVPETAGFDDDVRLLVMENASRDRDGSRRMFAETVPASCRTAIEAAAWQFDVPVGTYRQLQRAT